MRTRVAIVLVLVVLSGAGAHAASAPDTLNYQGVLRSAADVPLTGSYDMVFRFWSDASAGDEILVDQHLAPAAPVAVTGGLFNVTLGTGAVSDGLGPGSYTSLSAV